MSASTRTGEQDAIATATLAAGELEATFATGAGMVCCSLRHRGVELLGQRRGLPSAPGRVPAGGAYDADFAVEVGSTMSA
jgi:hypothetical protein